jgi:hypothetical protein
MGFNFEYDPETKELTDDSLLTAESLFEEEPIVEGEETQVEEPTEAEQVEEASSDTETDEKTDVEPEEQDLVELIVGEDKDGNPEIEEVPYNELVEAYKKSKEGFTDPTILAKAQQFDSYNPFIRHIQDNPISNEYLRHIANGNTPERTIEGMFLKLYPKAHEIIANYYAGNTGNSQTIQEEEEPKEMTFDQEVDAKVEKLLNQKLQAMGIADKADKAYQATQEAQQNAYYQKIMINNENVFKPLIEESGYDYNNLTPYADKFQKTLSELFPGTNLNNYAYTPAQAKAIASVVFPPIVKKAATGTARQLTKVGKVPHILPTKGKQSQQAQKLESLDGYSKGQRADSFKALFGD